MKYFLTEVVMFRLSIFGSCQTVLKMSVLERVACFNRHVRQLLSLHHNNNIHNTSGCNRTIVTSLHVLRVRTCGRSWFSQVPTCRAFFVMNGVVVVVAAVEAVAGIVAAVNHPP